MAGFWKNEMIPSGDVRHWRIGELSLHIQRREGEWRLWHETALQEVGETNSVVAQESEEPESISSVRFAYDSDDDSIVLEPRFPDRPIVSYPGASIEVPAGERATFVCGIPLCVCITSGKGDHFVPLTTLPLRELSKTWFGTALEGEACYSASTEAVRDYRELSPNHIRALCTVTVINKTKTSLPIERICIHVEHLQLFEGDSYLWTNEVFVNKESEHETSRVTYGTGAPKSCPDAELKLEPRVRPPQSSLFLKTFNHLRTFLSE